MYNTGIAQSWTINDRYYATEYLLVRKNLFMLPSNVFSSSTHRYCTAATCTTAATFAATQAINTHRYCTAATCTATRTINNHRYCTVSARTASQLDKTIIRSGEPHIPFCLVVFGRREDEASRAVYSTMTISRVRDTAAGADTRG